MVCERECIFIVSVFFPMSSQELFRLSLKSNTGIETSLMTVNEKGGIVNVTVKFEANPDLTTAVDIDITDKDPRLFWKMPDVLISSLLSLYGTDISFTINYVIVGGEPLTDHKALIIDKAGNVIVCPLFNVTQGYDSSLLVTLRESSWQKNGTSTFLTRGEFLKVLSTTSFLLLPASFAKGNHTAR